LKENGLPKTSFHGFIDILITLIATDAHSIQASMAINGLYRGCKTEIIGIPWNSLQPGWPPP